MTQPRTGAAGAGTGRLQIGVLGPMQVEVDGRPVLGGGAKPRALLAVLVVNANRPVSGARLASEMYEGRVPVDPAATVRVHVANVRSAFGVAGLDRGVLTTDNGGYILHLDPSQTDAGRFDTLCRAARDEDDPEAALELVEQALGLWRGDPYEHFADLMSVRPEARRLEEAARSAQAFRADLLLALGRHRALVGELESLVARHPLDETLRRQLMLALYRSGRQTDALRCYQEARQLLRQEYGAEPGPSLLQLEHAILRHDPMLVGHPVRGPAGSLPPTGAAAGDADSGDGGEPEGPDDEASGSGDAIARYLSLPEEVRRWVGATAVLGGDVSPADVAAVLAADPTDGGRRVPDGADVGLRALALAADAGLLVPTEGAPARWRFVAEAARAAVYDEVDLFTRGRLHEGCARLLEATGAADDPTRVGALADHAERASTAGLADHRLVSWLLDAGRQAVMAREFDAAVRWFTRALHATDHVAPVPGSRRSDIQVLVGDAHWRAGRVAPARQTFLDVLEAARRHGDPRLFGRAAVGVAGDRFLGCLPFANRGVEASANLVGEALSLIGDGDDGLKSQLMAQRAVGLASLGAPEEAYRLSAAALAVAEQTGDPRCVGDALACRSTALCLPHHLGERETVVDRLQALARSLGDDELGLTALRHRIECLVQHDDLDTARGLVERAGELAADLRQPLAVHRAQLLRTMLALIDGRWAPAQQMASAALATGQGAGDQEFSFFAYMVQMAVVHYNRRDLRELEAMMDVLVANVPGQADVGPGVAGEPGWRTWQPVICMIECWLGRDDAARARLRWLAEDRCRQVPLDQVWFCNVAVLVDVADTLEDTVAAADLYQVLEPFRGLRASVPGIIALSPVPYYLGLLARLLGRFDEAERWLREATRRTTRSSVPSHPGPWAMAGLAAVLARHLDRSVRTEAEVMVTDAEALARAVGSQAVLERLRAK